MVKTLSKRQMRMLIKHKSFYIGVSLLIILSVSLLLGFSTSTSSIKHSVLQDRITSNLEDANFMFSNIITDEQMISYENNYNLIMQDSIYKEVSYDEAIIRIRPDYIKLNKYSVVHGESLQSTNTILVDRFFYDANNLVIGQQLNINGLDFELVGVLAAPDYLGILKNDIDIVADGNKFGLAYVSYTDFDNIEALENHLYSVKYHEDNSEDFRIQLSNDGIISDYTSIENNIRVQAFDGEISAMQSIAQIAPIFIMIISMLIMAISLSRQLKKEFSYIGTLKALGYKTNEITIHYLTLPIIITLTSCVIGIGFGFLLAEPLQIMSKAEYSIPKIELQFSAINIILSFGLPIFLTIGGAIHSIIKAVKTNTVVLLKANSNKEKKPLLLKIIPHKIKSFKLRFQLKEILSNASRSILMFFGVLVSGLFLLSGVIIYNSIDVMVQNSVDELYDYEYQYILKAPAIANPYGGEEFMAKELVYETSQKTYGVMLNGIKTNSEYISLVNTTGEPIELNKTVFSYSVTEKLGLKINDTVILKNSSNLKTYTIIVEEIANIKAGNNIFMSKDDFNALFELPQNLYIGLYSNDELNIDESLINQVYLAGDVRDAINNSIALFKGILYILAIIAAIIAMIVIYIVTIMLIDENSKTISMLKVMGYHPKEINSILINSSFFLVALGFLLAIPLSSFIMNEFLIELTKNMYYSFDTNVLLWQAIVGFIFILIVYFVTLQISKRKVYSINMAESLKARE